MSKMADIFMTAVSFKTHSSIPPVKLTRFWDNQQVHVVFDCPTFSPLREAYEADMIDYK